MGGAIKDAAGASAIVVRRLRDAVGAMRRIPEQQVRGAAGRLRDILSLLTWAYTLSEAGWRHSYRPAGQDIERLCHDGRALYDWLLGEIMGRTGLSRGELEIASGKRRGSAADDLRLLDRDDPDYLGWLVDQIQARFPGAVEYLPLGRRKDRPEWLTVTEAAKLLQEVVSGIRIERARARVSKAAKDGKFQTNGEQRQARRIDQDSFSSWLLKQREKHLASFDVES